MAEILEFPTSIDREWAHVEAAIRERFVARGDSTEIVNAIAERCRSAFDDVFLPPTTLTWSTAEEAAAKFRDILSSTVGKLILAHAVLAEELELTKRG